MLLVVLMFMFATYGVHVLGGKLHKCNDPSITTKVRILLPHHYNYKHTRIDISSNTREQNYILEISSPIISLVIASSESSDFITLFNLISSHNH